MANRIKLTPEKRERFLAALCKVPNVSRAARLIGLSRRHMYDVRDDDPDFAALWDDAVEVGCDRLEEEAHRRAVNGVTRPVYQQGKEVGRIKEFSDTLLIVLLKAHRPEKYRDRQDITSLGEKLSSPIIYLPAVEEGDDRGGDGG